MFVDEGDDVTIREENHQHEEPGDHLEQLEVVISQKVGQEELNIVNIHACVGGDACKDWTVHLAELTENVTIVRVC